MFNKLVASGKGAKGASSKKTMAISIVLHGLLLAGVVYASNLPPSEEDAAEEEVTFLEIEENEVEPEAPEPEPPPPTPVDVPPPPQGFQELIPPLTPPPVIPPPVENAPPVNIADFSGIGVAGGTSQGVSGGVPQDASGVVAADSTAEPGFAYQVAVLDSPPALSNMTDVQRALVRNYPRLLLDAGISGAVTMRFVIEPDGTVDESSLQVVTATNDQFRTAAGNVVEMMRFRPGRYRGEAVRVLIEMPINFQAGS
jgi:periplasmic protein TonB